MPITPGTKLGTYEVLSLIGAGGMGEVYQAHDSKLGRDVAIKVLPEAFAHDPQRLARFQREAKMLASLNHPNIAAIYGLEQSGNTHYLVMELVPGQTLAQRIRGGTIPLDEALPIARQVADAVEYAHDKSVIHRDLKPANIKVTAEGMVKVLDFGLSKALSDEPTQEDISNSPTLSMAATRQGVILGTAAYMSPEQAKGKTVDRRTDVWAFGVVLYEVLTGRPAFPGDDITEVLAAVVRAEPDWNRLPKETPTAIRILLRRCLEKHLKRRLMHIGEARIVIEDALSGNVPTGEPATQSVPYLSRLILLVGLPALLMGGLIVGLVAWKLRPPPVFQPVSRFTIPLPSSEQLPPSGGSMSIGSVLALSQDGTQLAYVAGTRQQIYVRALDSTQSRPLPGTEGGASPFFSPDGQWIGFFAAGKLKKVAISGGAVLTLCDAPQPRGGTWAANGNIVFAGTTTAGLMQVPAAGGAPQSLTKLKEGEAGHSWPQFLPGDKIILYAIQTTGGNFDNGNIAAYRLDTGEEKILIRGGTFPRYVPVGYLVYYRAGTILATPFDPARLEVGETSAPAVEGVMGGQYLGVGQFSFSNVGSLVYITGGSEGTENRTLIWVDRQGHEQTLPAPPRAYQGPRVSPDGRQVAVAIGDNPASSDIWVYDLIRDTLSRVTYEGVDAYPIWTPDSKRIVYRSFRPPSPPNLFWKPADGSEAEEKLTTSEFQQTPASISPNGKILAYMQITPKATYDIFTVPLEGEHKPQPFLATPFDERGPWFSPDGRWAAYVSNETGQFEVYVQPFPGTGGKRQISTDGGIEIQWSSNGKELLYRTGAQRERMMAVDIQTRPAFSAGKPRKLFEGPYASNLGNGSASPTYSIGQDGRFLMLKAIEQQKTDALTQINVVQNWFEELKRRVPVTK